MPQYDSSPLGGRGAQDFATTQWSLVLVAGDGDRQEAQQALATLCEAYWLPLYAYVRRRVPDRAEAQDLTQSFFGELLEKNFVASARPERGRFRAFLLTALKHFLSKEWERARAQKRGGGRAPISLDFALAESSLGLEPAAGLTPEQIFDRQWAITLLDKTIDRLASECATAGKSRQFELLRGYLVGDSSGATYAEVAAELGSTEGAVKQGASRLRRRYRELLREEIAQTVASPEEVTEEIHNLFSALQL